MVSIRSAGWPDAPTNKKKAREGGSELTFDFSANAGAESGLSDEDLYIHVMDMASLGHRLGYDTLWMVEHHFSDYYPSPSPLVLLSYVAALCPRLSLGTMVLVTPWYDARRLAEEISILSHLTKGDLHLGLGRGTAFSEYQAFDVPMEEARERFKESYELIDLALQGEPFTYSGQYLRVPQEITLRPVANRDKINFYGAIGNPLSAGRMAQLGLSPLSISYFDYETQEEILSNWAAVAKARRLATDVSKVIAVNCVIADSDEEAEAIARKYLPTWFQMQVEHYEVDKRLHRNIKTYEAFDELLGKFHSFSDPATMDSYLALQFVGTAETIGARIERYQDAGFNRFIVQAGVPGTPRSVQRDVLTRFAKEVAPEYSSRFNEPVRKVGL